MVDGSGTCQVYGDEVGVGADTGVLRSFGGGGGATAENTGGGEEEGEDERVEVMIFRREERAPGCCEAAEVVDGMERDEAAAEVWYGAGADPFSRQTGTKP